MRRSALPIALGLGVGFMLGVLVAASAAIALVG